MNNKFIQDKPLWPDEVAERKVIYPYRFDFSIEYVLEQPRWRKDRIKVPLAIQEMRRGISLLLERTVETLYAAFAGQFHYNLLRPAVENPPMSSLAKAAQEPGTHRLIQDLLFEIGNLNRLVCEKEYPMESERLDVVWRRVERSVPTYAFEIQVGGDIYHALGKLKHAHDLWNSNIFLVASETDKESVSQLMAGTFHEIEKVLRTLSPEVVRELHDKKRKWVDLERAVGLL